MEFIIRKMKETDIQQVQQVAKISWNCTYEGIIPLENQENFLKYAYSDAMMQKRLEQTIMRISEINGKIVGFANFSAVKENGETELAAIYVHPEYQGKGIGTALLNEGIKNLIGAKKILLNVEKDNTIGTTFYKVKGFKVVSEFDEDFEGHILKTLRMCLNLEN